MAIVRDIVSDFSNEEEIEICSDEEDVQFDSSSSRSMTYTTPSSFFLNTNSQVDRDIGHITSLTNVVDNDLFIGLQFESKEATINVIREFHIRNSFDYIVVESRPDRYVAKCKHFGAGYLIVNLVSADPSIPVKALVKEVVSRFGYTVTYRKAWTAKQMAMAKIYGDWEGSYKELPRWMNALQYFCPHTIVKYQAHHEVVDGMEDPSRIILDRIFWAFKPCIEGFGYCKPILQVDGTFLTEKYTGTLLIASSQDGNRRVFPVAFAIVEGETKEAWEWFFYNLKTYVTPQENLCIISDRGTGLLAALRSYELIRPRFERMLNSLRQKNSRAGAWLDQIPKEKWSQAYDEGRRYGHMRNGARLNEWFNEHRNEASNMVMAGHVYCEELTKVIKENQRKSTCQMVRNFSRETGVSEVEVVSRSAGRQVRLYTVKLAENWCDCGEFQSLRLPCSHAIATCASLNLDCSQFISTIYRLDNLQKVYGYEFQPLGNEEYWPPYSGPTFIPNSVMRMKRSGRPKTSRIHNEMDEVEGEQLKKCGWCRTEGHNRKTSKQHL
ncbi:PREDICTED: uncharacterized protein LOC109359630 [Lupinus angustifolius]|uniref:uncharacterized protein LOC109359630 n=1 Tax=Lupinus angustifolius TaxID=3871 RepID=UPI00092F019A|nr:PREDICTED: uncharacterized protein LOC109359630 [Lupinus angustifolius]